MATDLRNVRPVLLSLLVVAEACSSDGNTTASDDQPTPAELFSSATSQLIFEVDYQNTAEPYTGSAGLAVGDVWQVTRANVARVFQGNPKQLTIPTTLAEMESLSDITGTSFTANQILAIADRHRDEPSMGSTASYYVLFLDGYFADEDGVNMKVLGVSIGGSGVIAMFKPVIASSEGALPGIARYVEQSTLVHEFGHSIGLVNNGIDMVRPHQDTTHGAHCSNEKCVMYWANEGMASAAAFARQSLTTGSKVLFAADCLADVDAEAAANP